MPKIVTLTRRHRTNKRIRPRPKQYSNALTLSPKYHHTKMFDPMVEKLHTKFVYSDVNFGVALTSGNQYNNSYVFNINSLYDPDRTGVGKQPFGYDNIMGAYGTGLFNWYRVKNAKIEVFIHRLVTNPSTTNNTDLVRCVIVPNTQYNGLPVVDYADLVNYKGSTSGSFKGNIDKTSRIVNKASVKQVMPLGSNPDDQWANYNASPTDACCFMIYFIGTGTLTADSTVNFDVRITYDAELNKVTPIDQS